MTPLTPAAAGKGTAAPAAAGTTLPPMSEAAWQGRVIDYARLRGWTVMHHPDSRRATAAGWPDLSLVRPPRLIFAELKAQQGRVRPEQALMHAVLRHCSVDVWVWRPSDWPQVMETLA